MIKIEKFNELAKKLGLEFKAELLEREKITDSIPEYFLVAGS